MNRARGAAAACLTAGALLMLRQFLSDGLLWGVLAAFALLAVPTSRQLSRRIAISGLIVVGWLPVLWWLHLPTGGLGRTAILLASVVAGLAYYVACGNTVSARRRLRNLLPEVRWVDLTAWVAGAVALAQVWPWFRVRASYVALAQLGSGWDNAAHFDYYFLIRRFGVTPDRIGLAPDGSAWSGSSYPVVYHSLAAAVTDLLHGPTPGSGPQELVNYLQADGILFVFGALLATAAACSHPRVRRNPVIALPLVAIVGIVATLGTGSSYLLNGNPNFVLALAVAATAILISITLPRATWLVADAALVGALVAIANSWPLLLTVAVPAIALVLVPIQKVRYRAPRRIIWSLAALALAGAFGAWHAMGAVRAGSAANFLTVPGYTPGTSIVRATAVNGIALLVALFAFRARGRGERGQALTRVAASSIAVLVGVGTAVVIAWLEVSHGGGLSYYFWKYLAGDEAIVASLAVAGTMYHLGERRSGRFSARIAVAAATALVAIWLAAGSPGAYVRVKTQLGWIPGAEMFAFTRTAVTAIGQTPEHLIAASTAQSSNSTSLFVYLPLAPQDSVQGAWAEEWFRGLTGTWTERAMYCGLMPPFSLRGVIDGSQVVRNLAPRCADTVFLVVPELVAPIRAAVESPELAVRVRTW